MLVGNHYDHQIVHEFTGYISVSADLQSYNTCMWLWHKGNKEDSGFTNQKK